MLPEDDINKLYEELEDKFKQFRDGLIENVDLFVDHALYEWCEEVLSGKMPIREDLKNSVTEFIKQQHKELSEKLERNHP